MAVTAQGSGTVTPTVGAASTLLDVAIAGTFTLHVDLINLAAADIVELRVYQIVLTAGTRRVVYMERYAGVQPVDGMIAVSVPISNELTDAGAVRFTLTQTVGTARAYPWKCLRYA